MPYLLAPFVVLALVGLFLSVASHVAALLNLPQPLGAATSGLHVGVFVVFLPAVLVSMRLVKDFKQKDFWKAVLRGCPRWMRWMVYAIFAYAVVNFVVFALNMPRGAGGGGANPPPNVVRGFSGHWMAFYSVATAILYSGIVVSRRDPARRCPNGHPVPPSANDCESCGSPMCESNPT